MKKLFGDSVSTSVLFVCFCLFLFVFPFVFVVVCLFFVVCVFIPGQSNDSGDLKEKEIESIFFFLD